MFCSLGWPQTHCIAKANLELLIFLPLHLNAEITMHIITPDYGVLGLELRALCHPGKHSANVNYIPSPKYHLLKRLSFHPFFVVCL